MKKPDTLLAITPVIRAFDDLSIPSYLGGSIPSSVRGVTRAIIVVGIMADPGRTHVQMQPGISYKET